MHFKSPRLLAVLSLLVLAAVPVILVTSCSKGSIDETARGSAPIASLTQAANCVVDSDEDVVVGSGTSALPGCADVVLEPSPAITVFGAIDVETGGTLEIKGTKSATGTAAPEELRQICVDGGTVKEYSKSGTSTDPIDLEFVGNRNYIPSGKINKCEEAVSKGGDGFRKGIDVMAGTLILKGAKGVPEYDANGNNIGGVSWTTLAAPAGPLVPGAKVKSLGDKKLYLSADVTQGPEGWQAGDWIVVATTDYDPFHSEFVQIAAPPEATSGGVAGAKSVVTLEQPLVYYHFGSLPPSSATATVPNCSKQPAFLCDGANRNYGVDERAEVGLISRDVTLTAQTEKPPATPPASPDSSVYWGGEIKIHADFTKVEIQGVRLSKFGKDKLGSYPIHFHQVGPIGSGQKAIIDADSVDHSYNKCVTLHALANLTISNMVCARIVGHIFYEELDSAGQVNQASDSGIVFNHDLGIGAMSNSFDIYGYPKNTDADRQTMINKYWWKGDYMTNDQCAKDDTCINYDGFNIPDTDNQMQDTHGFCATPETADNFDGYWQDGGPPPCPPPNTNFKYYIEPASGFWIQNPGTTLTNDAIAGCQGAGVGYWWVPPPPPIKVAGIPGTVNLKLNPLGTIKDDRSSACYHSYFAEGENGVVSGQLASPIQNGENAEADDVGPNIISHFVGLTATHSRWRGFWIRGDAAWFVLTDGHFADDNRGATFLTSGGIDGNGPGVWDLVKDSVFVGASRDNVGRWGPCPEFTPFGKNTGWAKGCIDYSHPTDLANAHSAEINTEGYPWPQRNNYGYQIYDGPALLYHDRFVNFNYNTDPNSQTECNDPTTTPNPSATKCAFSAELDYADRQALADWQQNNTSTYNHYEGDAALGWFPSNQSAYPTATASKQLMWKNTNFRHQVFTNLVNIGKFNDGDRNTAILDEDGTLAGFGVESAPNSATVYAASLNNLPFNATSNAVDECFSRGAQDQALEGRDSSLMAPAELGTLEFSNLYPWVPGNGTPESPKVWPGNPQLHWQQMTFTRTDKINNGKGGFFKPSMSLLSRNGQGIWEPRVANGYGYTVAVAPTTNSRVPVDERTLKAGIYKWIDVGVADVVDPNITKTHPFYIRLGIDYATVPGTDPKAAPVIPPKGTTFTIKRGYKSYFGGAFNQAPVFRGNRTNTLYNYFTKWDNCQGLDGKRVNQIAPNVPFDNKPAGCPAGRDDATLTPPIVTSLSPASSYADLTNPTTGEPVIGKYYYNTKTGYLWLNIVQEVPNAQGPSPIGSCDSAFDGGTPDPDCQWKNGHGESYYVCPKNGCIIYTIQIVDPPPPSTFAYAPATSPTPAVLPPTETFGPPAKPNKLTLIYPDATSRKGAIVEPEYTTDKQKTVYAYPAKTTAPACTPTQHDSGG